MGIAQTIKAKQDFTATLRAALEKIVQLYTDDVHFIYELLQNAEDAKATTIKFVQHEDRLEVLHNGKPFTGSNLQGLYDVGLSDKVEEEGQIGKFGVGFKSVFSICQEVSFYSNPKNYRSSEIGDAQPFGLKIVDFIDPVDIAQVVLPKPYTTKFVFPYAVGLTFSGFKTLEALKRNLSAKLQKLSSTTLLFMKSLDSIDYEIHIGQENRSGKYKLTKKRLNHKCVRVDTDTLSYLVFSKDVQIQNVAKRTIDIAFPFQEKGENWQFTEPENPYIFVFFPTGTESKLKFIVQGPYKTTPNRSDVKFDDEENKMFAEETAQLVYDSIVEIRNMGRANLSLLNLLPMNERDFYQTVSAWSVVSFTTEKQSCNLFAPVYDKIKLLFNEEKIIPGIGMDFICAKQAKLVRGGGILKVIPDELLTDFIGNGKEYHWVSETITRSNTTYSTLFDYLTKTLGVEEIDSDDFGGYLAAGEKFLTSKLNDYAWLKCLYDFLKMLPAMFPFPKGSSPLMTAKFIKSQSGKFVAPYAKDSVGNYVAKVFIPIDGENAVDGIEFVDYEAYSTSPDFFKGTLRLTEPDKFNYWLKGLEKRYSSGYNVSNEQHIEDVKQVLHYLAHPDHRVQMSDFAKNSLLVRCNDGQYRNPYKAEIYFTKNEVGIDIQHYFENIYDCYFIDSDLYFPNGIQYNDLLKLNISDNLIEGDNITFGEYITDKPGKNPNWSTVGSFRWMWTIKCLPDALSYISNHPQEATSYVKSSVIFKLLQHSEECLRGVVKISGGNDDINPAYAKAIQVIREKGWDNAGNKRIYTVLKDSWHYEWLYTKSLELVRVTQISKHDLNTDLYGEIKFDSKLYEYLKFKKEDIDRAEDNLKEFTKLPQEKRKFFGAQWLKEIYGITTEKLEQLLAKAIDVDDDDDAIETPYEFPKYGVRNWESLRQHTAEVLAYAQPVKYLEVIRKIRGSKNAATIKTYLYRMYKVEGRTNQYACQLCHKPFTQNSIEMCQIDERGGATKELDQMYLCVCPNCSSKFKVFQRTSGFEEFKDKLKNISQEAIDGGTPVKFSIDDNEELWFTQTHIAEISELMRLQAEVEKEAPKIVSGTDKLQDSDLQAAFSKETSQVIRVPMFGKGKKVTWADVNTNNLKGKRLHIKNFGTGSDVMDCLIDIVDANVVKATITARFVAGKCGINKIGDTKVLSLNPLINKGYIEFI